VSVSVSRSRSLRLTNASSKPLSVADVAVSVAAVAVEMELPEAAEARDSVEDVEMVPEADVAVAMVPTEADPVDHEATLPPSTPTTPLPSPAWEQRRRLV